MKISIFFPFIFWSFAYISSRPFVRRPFRKNIRRRRAAAYLHDKLRKTMNTVSFVGYGNGTIRHHAQGHCNDSLGQISKFYIYEIKPISKKIKNIKLPVTRYNFE